MKKDRKMIRMKRKNRVKKEVQINPMMPRKYNIAQRKRIRELEKELLKDYKASLDKNDNIILKKLKLERNE